MSTFAAELRAAAAELRGLSGMASRGRWRVEANRPNGVGQSFAVRPYSPGTREPAWFKVADGCTVMDANLIAAMNPTVALAVAEWLDHTAALIEGNSGRFEGTQSSGMAMLTARAINGGAS